MLDRNNYVVYKHTNKQNGLVYIGITAQKPFTLRWGPAGGGYRDQKIFYNAIKKYGWDNFDHEILEEGLSEEEAQEKEKYYISQFDSTNKLNGYNISKGGDITSVDNGKAVNLYDSKGKYLKTYKSASELAREEGLNVNCISHCCLGTQNIMKKLYTARYLSEEFPANKDIDFDYDKIYQAYLSSLTKRPHFTFKHTDEARRKMSEARKGKTPVNKGKKMSDEARRKMSEARKGRKFGPRSEETKRKIGLANKGDNNGMSLKKRKEKEEKILN